MNERIKELAVQSNLVFNPSKTTELYCSYMEDTDLTEYVEKFADLIIQDYRMAILKDAAKIPKEDLTWITAMEYAASLPLYTE